MSFEKEIFLDSLKLANVIPVLKKGSNYRPKSLTSNISKVMEKLIHQRLFMFLEPNEILYKNQFGFRNKHSANHASINITIVIRKRNDYDITVKIRDALYQKQFAFGVFIDLQKAFDSVNHEIHLDKLHYHTK